MKRLISITLSFLLLLTATTPLYAYASVKTDDCTVSLLQEGNFDECETIEETSQLSTAYSNLFEAQDFIYTSLSNVKSNFSIGSYKIDKDDFALIYANVINDHPDLFYVSSSVGYSYYENAGTVATVYPCYSVESKDIEAAKKIYNKGLMYAVDLVDDSMDDVQKALVIHDYLCMNALYPKLTNSSDDKQIYHSAYGFFYDGKVVCAGYALAYSAIMNYLGVPCKYVISNAMAHAWNIIQINGKWYNVDLTYDDLYMTQGENAYSMVAHNCFLKSTESLSGNMGIWHKDITYPDGITCDDTTYDNAFWNDINTDIPVVNGDYYYIYCNVNKLKFNIVKRDKKGNTSLVSSDTYMTSGLKRTSVNPNDSSDEHCYYIFYSPLVGYNNRLYFAEVKYTSSSVKNGILNSINYDGSDKKSFVTLENSNCFLSLGVENGDLLYLPIVNMVKSNKVVMSRTLSFDNAFESDGYDSYADVNNDGINNAKDYAMIMNGKY